MSEIENINQDKNKDQNQNQIVEYKVSYEKNKSCSNTYDTYVRDTHITFFHETTNKEVKKVSLVIDGQYTDDCYDGNYYHMPFSLRINDKLECEGRDESLAKFVEKLYGHTDSKESLLFDIEIIRKLTNIANSVHIYPVTQFNVTPEKRSSLD